MAKKSFPPQAYTKDVLVAAIDWLAYQPQHVREGVTHTDDLIALYTRAMRLEPAGGGNLGRKPRGGETSASAQAFSTELKSLAQNISGFNQSELKQSEVNHADDKNHSVQKSESLQVLRENNLSHNSASRDFVQREIVNEDSNLKESKLRESSPRLNNSRESVLSVHSFPQVKVQASGEATQEIENKKQEWTSELKNENKMQSAHRSEALESTSSKISAEAKRTKNKKIQPSPLADVLDEQSLAAVTWLQAKMNLSTQNEALRVLISFGEKKLKSLFSEDIK